MIFVAWTLNHGMCIGPSLNTLSGLKFPKILFLNIMFRDVDKTSCLENLFKTFRKNEKYENKLRQLFFCVFTEIVLWLKIDASTLHIK